MSTPEVYAAHKRLGICAACGSRDAVPGRIHCGACAERMAENRAAWRVRRSALGFCRSCGKHPAAPGLKSCQICTDLAAQRRARKKAA